MSITAFGKEKIKNIILIYAVIMLPMWLIFLVNNIFLQDFLSKLGGIYPRDMSLSMFGIATSWMFHGSAGTHIYDHILGNSTALFGLLLIVAILESKPLKLMVLLILGSGFMTWLLGSSSSYHIGASGLVFALFGYVIASILFCKRWVYLVPLFILGGDYFYSFKAGLIPQDGVSFSAHFGGLIAGLVIGYYFNKSNTSTSYKSNKTLKEKYNDIIWDIKYYFKNKFVR